MSDQAPQVIAITSQRGEGPPTPGHFEAWTEAGGGGIYLHCLLGENPPKPVRGYGGWGPRARDGRRGRASFQGSDLPAFSIDLLLEQRRVREDSPKAKMRLLERLCGWESVSSDDPPPPFYWKANAPHHDYVAASQNRWVCETLEWGTWTFDNRSRLLSAEATIVVGLYRTGELPTLARKVPFRQVTMRKGESLREFAKRVLGDPKRWKDVQSLNRDNPRCPTSPSFAIGKPLALMVPPKDS
jgi:hypothetical protein